MLSDKVSALWKKISSLLLVIRLSWQEPFLLFIVRGLLLTQYPIVIDLRT